MWKWRKKKTTRDLVPDYLLSTYDLLTSAFPTGIDPDLYVPLLALLEPHISHRNLADILWVVTGREYHLTSRDVVGAAGAKISEADLAKLHEKLDPHGLAAWLAEP
jgi:hypothetical protein